MAETERVHIRIEKELLDQVDEKAKELHVSRSALLRIAVVEFLKKNEK